MSDINANQPLGQIVPNSPFGRLLTYLAKQSNIIVEIGTWHGEGSTRCLANGLIRPEQRFYAIESSRDMFDESRSRYSDPRIVWLNGTVSPMNDALIILDQLPPSIDLLLIDGGDHNGWSDFLALWTRTKIIALDDTNDDCIKGKKSRACLIEHKWTPIADRQNDRNGWCVFQRPAWI